MQKRVAKEFSSIKSHPGYIKSPTLGTRFFQSPWSHALRPDFIPIIESFQELIPCYEGIIKTGSRPSAVGNDCLCLLCHRLLSLTDECAHDPLEDTLRLSILVYCVTRLWIFQGLPCMPIIVDHFQRSIVRGYMVLQNQAPDLLFWALFMGSLASQELDCHPWFLNTLMDVAEMLSLTDWESAREVLEGFFFMYRSTDEPAKIIWDSALELRFPKLKQEVT